MWGALSFASACVSSCVCVCVRIRERRRESLTVYLCVSISSAAVFSPLFGQLYELGFACAYKSQMKGTEDEMIYSRRLKRAHHQITRALKSKMLLIIDQSNTLTMNAKKPKRFSSCPLRAQSSRFIQKPFPYTTLSSSLLFYGCYVGPGTLLKLWDLDPFYSSVYLFERRIQIFMPCLMKASFKCHNVIWDIEPSWRTA